MKKNFLTLTVFAFSIFVFSTFSWAQCPEDPNDRGECDTLNVICLDCEIDTTVPGPYFVRFPLLVTHDQTVADDSIAGFAIPFTWTHTNPSKYCSLGIWWNTTSTLWVYPDFARSIFRHIVEGTDTLYHNRLADLAADFSGRDWDTRILSLSTDPPFMGMALVPTGTADQRWWDGDRVLLATLTFRIEDTMHVCMDTTLWPPSSRITFSRSDGQTYIPRDNLPQCFKVGPPAGPCEDPEHFVFTDSTGDSYSIVIDSALLDDLELEECDEIGVFDDTGGGKGLLCVGASVYHPADLPIPLIAWKDDPLTPQKDGYIAGDTMYFRVWSKNQDREEEACAYYSVGDGHFESGFFSQLWLEAPCGPPPPESVTITSPNGGEDWCEGSAQSITWTSVNIDTVEIEYSTDGGSTWIAVVDKTPAGPGSYSWTVPNTPSTNCLVKICDAKDSSPCDQSDAVFTITPEAVTVTAPNGGENWCAGDDHAITWTSSCLDTVKIDYSTDGGSTWMVVVDKTPAGPGSYSWTVPNTPSTNCLVKICDAEDSSPCDQSDAVFTITPEAVTVTAPDGGENWCAGNDHAITWTSSCLDTVKIDYSTDGGSTWMVVVDKTPAGPGSYSWTVPNTPSTNCLVKICDAEDSSPCDQSDAVFTITPEAVTVTAPNGGENWCVDTTYNITWTYSCIDNVQIEYSTNGGSTWMTIIASTPSVGGSYAWTVPNTPSSNCLVRICDAADNNPCDLSDNFFTIEPCLPDTCIYPEHFVFTDSTSDSYSIVIDSAFLDGLELEECDEIGVFDDTGGGKGLLCVGASVYHPADLPIPLIAWKDDPLTPQKDGYTAGDTMYFRVWSKNQDREEEACAYYLEGDGHFESGFFSQLWLEAPCGPPPPESITVTSPNGGEDWCAGSAQSITWTSVDIDTVEIEYSTDGGSSWITVVDKTPAGPGSYSWTVPNTPSTNCLVKICDAEDNTPCDQSDAVFTISPEAVTVTAPNGRENWCAGDDRNITWTSSCVDSVKIEYSTDGGSTWMIVVGKTPAGPGSYSWTVPNTPSTNCLVKICDAEDSSPCDQSDTVFTIGTCAFYIEAHPDTQKVVVGDSTTYQVMIFSLPDFWAPCTLSIESGLPTGATYSFDPNPISEQNISILTIFTSASTPAEIYELTIRGIINPEQETTTTVVLIVQDFTISAAPDIQYVTPGQAVGYEVMLTSLFEFDEPCTLFVSGLPDPPDSGIFDQATLIPTDTTTLNVYTSVDTDTGWYTLSITAQRMPGTKLDGLQHSVEVMLRVEEPGDAGDWEDNPNTPKSFALFQNQPNPFNPETKISYYLPRACQVRLTIYNVLGQKVKTLFDDYQDAGMQTLIWDGRGDDGVQLSSGIYFYRLQADNFHQTKKMTLMK